MIGDRRAKNELGVASIRIEQSPMPADRPLELALPRLVVGFYQVDAVVFTFGQRYDLVVLNQRADLGTWARYRPGDSRIIYEANDSYISVPMTDPKQMLRGGFKFLSGQSRRLQLNYRAAVEDMCRRSDAVIVSTAWPQCTIAGVSNPIPL